MVTVSHEVLELDIKCIKGTKLEETKVFVFNVFAAFTVTDNREKTLFGKEEMNRSVAS